METPWVRFSCFCALLPTFLFSFLSLFCFSASRYVFFPRAPSSVQQPSATLSKYVSYSTCSFCLCHLYPTPSRNSLVFVRFVLFFRSSYFSGGVFLLCSRTRYASTWCAYVDSLATFVFFSVSVCDHIICISLGWRIRKDTEGTADVVG